MSKPVQENTRIIPDRQTSLTREQRESIGLLSIGTFLEYFDLMLYVHMAVLLNELFFEPTDPKTASVMAAFAFCTTYVLRPFGALLFGWIGDNYGRKHTVVITTFMMSISCIVMANLPTYAQIGITASWLVTICRIVQGLSSMGEVVGADIYVTEITKPPIQYPAVMLTGAICSALGGTFALGIASLVTSNGFNWRNAFWVGAGIAVIGAAARTRLRETPDFVDAKRRVKQAIIKTNQDPKILEKSSIWKEKVNKKTALALFFLQCSWSICFYIAYMYCGSILKNSFHLNSEQIIQQNFIVSMIHLCSLLVLTYLSYKIYPLNILKIRITIFLIFILFCPYLLNNAESPFDILLIQLFITVFGTTINPAIPLCYKYFPVFKRFTYASFTYALSRAFIYIVTSFSLVYCTNFLGHWGILVIIIPASVAFIYAIHHFEELEKVGTHHFQREDSLTIPS